MKNNKTYKVIRQVFGDNGDWKENYFKTEAEAINLAKKLYEADKNQGISSDITVWENNWILWCLGDFAANQTDGEDHRPCYVR